MINEANLNADGTLRIENAKEFDGKRYYSSLVLSATDLKVTVKMDYLTMDADTFFQDKSDSKTFVIGQYREAMDWAHSRLCDFQFRK